MLLTIKCTGPDAGKLGFLLHKHPNRFQSFPLSYGKCHVYYPDTSDQAVAVCLLLDIDPVAMTKSKRNRRDSFALAGYVNDIPYSASSFFSVAIAAAFGTAMAGRCNKFPEFTDVKIPVQVSIDVLPCRGDADLIRRIFEPLGYQVLATGTTLNDNFPAWGDSPYYSVQLQTVSTIAQLLKHLYVLIPVFDNQKHYFVDAAEMEKLLTKGAGWLEDHPERELIVSRYLKYSRGLANRALAVLTGDADEAAASEPTLATGEKQIRLNDQRLDAVVQQLDASGAGTVIDLGCGEGKLIRRLLKNWQYRKIVGVDVSINSLQIAAKRLKLDDLPQLQAERIKLLHGSLMYRDRRFAEFEAAAIVEVIEHLDPPRLSSFEQVVFKHARPKTVVVTTPNAEYNVMWPALPAGKFRHSDHRFEWTRQQFQTWATRVADSYGYQVNFLPIGDDHPDVGSPTQMAVFNFSVEAKA